MAFTTWGQTATHSTTVSASPAPTTTSCTVASVGSFREGMAVYFDVSGTPTRTFLTGVSGNALTFSPALSSAPDSGGDAVSYHQPIFNDKLNESALWREATTTSLRAVDTTGMPDGTRVLVEDIGIYRLDTAGAGTDDDHKIIDPTTGPGRWFLEVFGPAWVQDTNWISSFPTADGSKYQILSTNGSAGVIFSNQSNGPIKITQTSHGFSATSQIRWNGSSWVAAQGNSIANSTDVWTVLEVSGNDFWIAKSGRFSIPSHGLTSGVLYYLSASSAGALTSTKPVGSTSAPLGIYLPVLFIEDSNTVHVIGRGYPEIDNLLAEYAHSSGSDTNSITFSNLDLQSYGSSIRFVISMGQPASGFTYVGVKVNALTSGYYYTNRYDDGTNWQRFGATSAAQWNLGYTSSTGTSDQLFLSGVIQLSRDSSGTVSITGQYYTQTSNQCGDFWGIQTSTGNITSLSIGDFASAGYARFRASQTNFARLYRQ